MQEEIDNFDKSRINLRRTLQQQGPSEVTNVMNTRPQIANKQPLQSAAKSISLHFEIISSIYLHLLEPVEPKAVAPVAKPQVQETKRKPVNSAPTATKAAVQTRTQTQRQQQSGTSNSPKVQPTKTMPSNAKKMPATGSKKLDLSDSQKKNEKNEAKDDIENYDDINDEDEENDDQPAKPAEPVERRFPTDSSNKELVECIERDMLTKTPNVTWDNIGGLADAKALLEEAVVLPLLRPDFFKGLYFFTFIRS